MRQKKQGHKVSDHFSRRDFYCKCQNCSHAIKISLGLIGGLEFLRSLSKSRINILKGYECIESSEANHKFKRNHHLTGIAADVVIDKLSPKDVFLLALKVPEFKGIGLNLVGRYVHVDTRKDKERSLWVETESGHIVLTHANQMDYFDQPVLDDQDNLDPECDR